MYMWPKMPEFYIFPGFFLFEGGGEGGGVGQPPSSVSYAYGWAPGPPPAKSGPVCYGFAAVFNLIFDCPNFGGRGAPRGSTMIPLGRELVCSHRLSIHTTFVSGTVWPQFVMQF